MRKNALLRGLLGFPLGVFISYTITILISLCHADGNYSPVVPTLITTYGNEMNAVILQYILSGILGFLFAASTLIWENDDWSIAKQSFIHFIIVSFGMLPIAYLSHWMEHSIGGIFSYFSIYIIIYLVIWASKYITWRRKINEINDRLKQ